VNLQKWLLKVVVGFCRDIVVLEVLLAVESDGLGLHLTLLYIDFVTAKDDGNVLTNTDEVTWAILVIADVKQLGGLTMPIWDVLVGDTRCDVKHNDAALPVDVIAITETAELFLTGSVPDVKLNLTQILWCGLESG
jgi:hypothetical protein